MLTTAAHAQIFSEDFSGYAGIQNNTQGDTGLEIATGGNVAGWSTSGAGVMHAVDLANLGGESNPSDWAMMFWQDNVITLTTGIAANDDGAEYVVAFDYGTADYAGGQGTGAGDSLLVEVLRGDNSVLASDTFVPGAWGAGNYNLDGGLEGELPYIGDGTGDVRLRIGPSAGSFNQGRFAGEIDNLTVSAATSPTDITWTAPGTSGITVMSAVATATVNTNLTETVLVWDTSDQGFASTNDWTYRLSVGPTNAGPVSAQMTGLTSDTEYAWRFYGMRGTNDGWSVASAFITQLADAQTPLFTKAKPRVGRIVLEWEDKASHETGYALQRSTAGAGGPYSILANLPADAVRYTDGPLSTGTYHYRIAATNSVDGSSTRFADSQTNATVTAAALFFEDFDSYVGTQDATQADTGLPVAHSGNVTGWSKSGAGTMHAVNVDGGGDWAIMFFQDNVITQTTGIAANESGMRYEVSFDYGTAVYRAGANYAQRTQAGDSLLVEVLRGDNSVLASSTNAPGEWVDGNYNLDGGRQGSSDYIGDGTGPVRIRIGPTPPYHSGRFEGEIDNLAVRQKPEGVVLIVR